MPYAGRCHCGRIEVLFEPARPAAELQLRECSCTFCRRHGTTSVTDPAGKLRITLHDPAEVSRYQFALRLAEFLVCRTCGVCVAAVSTIDGATYATLNANVLDARADFTQAPQRVVLDGETAERRTARRRRAWTPARVVVERSAADSGRS